jgi:arylformamidase
VDIIKGGMCISGMYDLTPVRLSARNAYVAFDDATVATLSPMRDLDRLHAPVVVACGTCETPRVSAPELRICRCGRKCR